MPDSAAPSDIQGLADQALDNLVHQFARPLDFLRELVQNAIDAGTPRVEVWTHFVPSGSGADTGVLEVHVDDFGEGMDEAIIDTQLTRLFSSTKEGDLTKIGKFGIGFTSIFAIEPDAILLRTGRHGEAWELLFHVDRSFDKVRVDEPLVGTRITLFKRMDAGAVAPFVQECRWVLGYWCEHSDAPVLFGDRGDASAAHGASTADPFAAFAGDEGAAGDLVTVTRPLELDAELTVDMEHDGVRVVVGYADPPRYGFYNGGLTLLSTRNADALGEDAADLAHLSFKVKYDQLEHTLTRDNVLQDTHWHKAIGVLRMAAGRLRATLIQRAGEAITGGDDPSRWHGWLARECEVVGLHRQYEGFDRRVRFVDRHGETLTLREVERQERRHDGVLLECGDGPLADALERGGARLLRDLSETRALLVACTPPPLLWFMDRERLVVPADELYLVPDAVEPDRLSPLERRLILGAEELVGEAAGGRVELRIGAFGGEERAAGLPLAMESPDGGGVCRRDEDLDLRWLRVRAQILVVNRHHPTFQAQAAAAVEDSELAAYGLAQALLYVAGVRRPRRYRALLAEAARRHADQVGDGDGWGDVL